MKAALRWILSKPRCQRFGTEGNRHGRSTAANSCDCYDYGISHKLKHLGHLFYDPAIQRALSTKGPMHTEA